MGAIHTVNGSHSSLDPPQLADGTNHSSRSALHVAASSANPSARSSAYSGREASGAAQRARNPSALDAWWPAYLFEAYARPEQPSRLNHRQRRVAAGDRRMKTREERSCGSPQSRTRAPVHVDAEPGTVFAATSCVTPRWERTLSVSRQYESEANRLLRGRVVRVGDAERVWRTICGTAAALDSKRAAVVHEERSERAPSRAARERQGQTPILCYKRLSNAF